jgi:hypothetical protein
MGPAVPHFTFLGCPRLLGKRLDGEHAGLRICVQDFGEELVSEQRGLVGIEDEDDTGEMAAAGDGGGGGSGAAASRRPSKKRGVDAVKPAARKAAPASKKAKK